MKKAYLKNLTLTTNTESKRRYGSQQLTYLIFNFMNRQQNREKMDGRVSKKLVRAKKYKKLWRAITTHILKIHGR